VERTHSLQLSLELFEAILFCLIMLSHVRTVALNGMRVVDIDVQAHIINGHPGLTIVGLADKAVNESRERIRATISSLGLSLPAKKITINLAPANIVKVGTHFDLPITLAILVVMDVVSQTSIQNYFALGELSLDGKIRSVCGILPATIHAQESNSGIICPMDNGHEAAMAGNDIDVVSADNMLHLISHLNGKYILPKQDIPKCTDHAALNLRSDMSDIRGQESAKRAIKIAIAGRHNILMIGPPGAGKSMLASAISSILPPLSPKEILDVSIIKSIINGFDVVSNERPYRNPHHSASMAAIVGGGKDAKPGEVTLAHCGVLFLDELPEFQRPVLDALRQPLESHEISIARVNSHITYPAKFQLVAAMNPCKCGYFGEENKKCYKSDCYITYQSKISGPILDRIDIHINVPNTSAILFSKQTIRAESSKEIRDHILQVLSFQAQRYLHHNIEMNADLSYELLQKFCALDVKTIAMLESCSEKFKFSMRGYIRILRVSRTIADMEFSDTVQQHHVAEAITYRSIQ